MPNFPRSYLGGPLGIHLSGGLDPSPMFPAIVGWSGQGRRGGGAYVK